MSYNPKLSKPTPFKEHLEGKGRQEWEKAVDALYASGVGPIGHFYGLPIPFTLELIESGGAEWLTEALHASGTLEAGNSVISMKVTPFVAGSMSLKCFLDVKYERRTENDGLHDVRKVPIPCCE